MFWLTVTNALIVIIAIYSRMFDAGAILLAITTVPEAAMWIETNTLAYGKTCNPYDSRRIVGGSSGGEGALQGAAASLVIERNNLRKRASDGHWK